jgi:putative DNA methylase
VVSVVRELRASGEATVNQRDATSIPPTDEHVSVTDPPYYDNIGYADLSDFFYLWLRRALKQLHPDLFSTLLVPKAQELVATPYRFGGDKHAADEHFELGLGAAFERMRSSQAEGYPLTVIYAFKQSEESEASPGLASTGWETMLDGLLRAGLSVHGTWPLRSELGNRMLASGTNALASSIALVCRPRSETAGLATRKDFLTALKAELPDALRHLQQGNIAPVDLAQAAIGPGMAVFSRYSKVVEADGSAMSVRTALGLINQVLDETLAEQEADFDGDTRWAVAWFDQFGMNPGAFGVAETLSKAKNTAINGLVAAGILESKGGKVRLLDRAELPDAWNPTADARLTVWELAQHLIRALESGGEYEAADLLRRIGGLGDTARELAYRLYVICERKKWAKEALAYNALVVAWPEISRLAAAALAPVAPEQQELL